ncbi:hypothetical protein Goari_022190 [Gossypium aridum]|uniref:Uncharacterized protein n=1 Tax=Gossypium aridum TaxID=34290 RepID=A0A7J8YQI3_GOSAI|nr:hypothetical protein [Gossypium aridum]
MLTLSSKTCSVGWVGFTTNVASPRGLLCRILASNERSSALRFGMREFSSFNSTLENPTRKRSSVLRYEKGEESEKVETWTAEPREEVRQRLNWVQHVHQEIVQIREVLHPLGVAVKTLDVQVNDLISTWLAQNNGN